MRSLFALQAHTDRGGGGGDGDELSREGARLRLGVESAWKSFMLLASRVMSMGGRRGSGFRIARG